MSYDLSKLLVYDSIAEETLETGKYWIANLKIFNSEYLQLYQGWNPRSSDLIVNSFSHGDLHRKKRTEIHILILLMHHQIQIETGIFPYI